MEISQEDRDFRFDPRRLTWKWNLFHGRYGLMHPAPKSAQYTTTLFMGWTWTEARQACADANQHRTARLAKADRQAAQIPPSA